MTNRQQVIAACRLANLTIEVIADGLNVHPQTIKNDLAEMRHLHSSRAKARKAREEADCDHADSLARHVVRMSRKAS